MKTEDSFEERVHELIKDAYDYYSKMGIVPDANDIWNDVINGLVDELGTAIDKSTEGRIWNMITGEDEGEEEDRISSVKKAEVVHWEGSTLNMIGFDQKYTDYAGLNLLIGMLGLKELHTPDLNYDITVTVK